MLADQPQVFDPTDFVVALGEDDHLGDVGVVGQPQAVILAGQPANPLDRLFQPQGLWFPLPYLGDRVLQLDPNNEIAKLERRKAIGLKEKLEDLEKLKSAK